MLKLQVVKCGPVYEYAVFSGKQLIERGESNTEDEARKYGESRLTALQDPDKVVTPRARARTLLEQTRQQRPEILLYVLAATSLGRDVSQVVARAEVGEVMAGRLIRGPSWVPTPHARKRTPSETAQAIIDNLVMCSRTSLLDGKVMSTNHQAWGEKRYGPMLKKAQGVLETLFPEAL